MGNFTFYIDKKKLQKNLKITKPQCYEVERRENHGNIL